MSVENLDLKRGSLSGLAEIVSGYTLIVVGALGVVYDAWHRISSGLMGPIEEPEVLILLLSFLCAAVGLERVVTMRKIEEGLGIAYKDRQEIKSHVSALKSFTHFEVLLGTLRIVNTAAHLIENCGKDDVIMATGQYFPLPEGALRDLPKKYYDTVAERIRRASQEEGGDMEYHLITTYSNPVDDIRSKSFDDRKVSMRKSVKYVVEPWPFEVLLCGSYVIVALPFGPKEKGYRIAVKTDDAKFVQMARDWFIEVLWDRAA